MDLDALAQEKIDADTDFQATLTDLSDNEKTEAISKRKSEVLSQEFTSLKEKADKAAKAEELANNYKIRAEKAELANKKPGEGAAPTQASKEDDLTSKDLYALMDAKVPQDDVDEVVKAAKVLGQPIVAALKDPIVQGILRQREEHRKTANATNVTAARPGTKKASESELLAEASKGNIPAPGSKEAEDLFWAKRGGRR